MTPSVDVTSSWSTTHVLRGHKRSLSSIEFSPDGTLLATAAADKQAFIWAVSTTTTTTKTWEVNVAFVRSLVGHEAGLNDVAWSPDSMTLVTVADDKTARLWDASTGQCRVVLVGHSHHVFCVAYGPTGGIIATGGWDETVRIWNAKTGALIRTIQAHSESVTCVGFSRDGSVIVSSSYDGLVRMWDVANGQCLKTLVTDDDNSAVTFVSFSINSNYLLTSTLDGTIRLWNYKSREGTVVKSYTGHTNSKYCIPVHLARFHGDTSLVLSGSEDGHLFVWDLQSRLCLHSIPVHSDVVISVAAHPTLPIIATASLERDPTVKLLIQR